MHKRTKNSLICASSGYAKCGKEWVQKGGMQRNHAKITLFHLHYERAQEKNHKIKLSDIRNYFLSTRNKAKSSYKLKDEILWILQLQL